MKNKLLLMLSLMVIISTGTFSQNYFNNFDGIPLIVYTWGSNFDWLNDYDYSKIKEMGGNVVIHPDLNGNKFEKYRNVNIKMVPYQTDSTIANHIAKYTDAMYTIWEAEGTDPADGEITLNLNTSNTIIVPGGIRTVNNLTTPGYIITGPGYLQPLEYKIEASDTVKLRVEFRLKVEPDSTYGSIIPLSGNNNTVCRIQATYNGGHNIKDEVNIKASDFVSYGNWKTFSIEYDKFDIQDNWINIYNRLNGSHHKAITDVEYKIYFYGLNYLNLYCDDVRVYDLRGFDLFTDIYTQQRIKEQAKNINNINNFTTNSTDFDTMVVAWFPVDEHDFLDNWACVKKVNELVKENNNGRFLMENISAYWNGRVWDGSNIYKIDEFIKRAQPDIMSLNNFLYDWPHKEGTDNYHILNIENATVNHLSRLKNFNVPFFYALQTGLWLPELHRIPSEAQFLYSANLGLLFGAKGLTLGNYFFNEDSSDKITALVSFTNYFPQSFANQPLWETIKNILSLRLSGLFGKTLKMITQETQKINIEAITSSNNINHGKLQYIHCLPAEASNCTLDVGFFNSSANSDINYFMVVNRYYSGEEELKLGLQNLTGFNNWTLLNHIDTTSVSFIKGVNDCAEITDVIPQGDGILYGLAPTILLGGELNANESISGTNKLTGELRIKSGKTLTVSGTYNCEKNLIVESGGNLVINPGATLNFQNGAKLIVHGSITAIGTSNSMIDFNFQSVAENSQNGIYLNAGSIDTLVYCVIQNGYFGIKVSSSEPFINYCEIKNCTDGIYFYDSHYQPDMDEGTRVYNSNIHSNYSTGINLLESSPLLMGNNITGNYVGIKCLSNSSPFLGKPFDYGFNLVTGEYAALESDASSPVLGDDELMIGGLNSVYNDIGDYDVIASNESYIAAQNCWWGEYEAERVDFELLDRSELFYDPALEYDPLQSNAPLRIIEPLVYQSDGGTLPEDVIPMSPVENSVNKQYKQALQKYINGQYAAARSLCKSIILSSPDSTISYAALRLLKNMVRDSNSRDSLKGFLQSNLQNAQPKEFNVYAKIMLADLNKNDYINTLNGIVSWYPVTVKKPYILFKKFLYYLNEAEDKEGALTTFNQMTTAYPTHTLTREAKHLLGQPTLLSKGKTTVSVKPVTYELTQNYPNPFNPVTTIKYGIKERTDVRVDVFDILGRKIKTVVNEPKDAGYYEVVFDASKLSSGVYIYRLTTKDFTASRKMMVVK